MQAYMECIPCFINQAVGLARKNFEDRKEQIGFLKGILSEVEKFDMDSTPPKMGGIIHRRLQQKLGVDDPYKQEKRTYNEIVQLLEDEIEEILEEAEDPFNKMLKMDLASNYIDFGIGVTIEKENVLDVIKDSLEEDINYKNTSLEKLKKDIKEAENILFLGDNCGELVMDKIFLDKFFDTQKIKYAVREGPVINDATLEDAKEIGLDKTVDLIKSGAQTPGTVLDECSEEFLKEFNKADIIIAKGQGNYESLSHCKRGGIYFLLRVKCDVASKDTDMLKNTNAVIYKE